MNEEEKILSSSFEEMLEAASNPLTPFKILLELKDYTRIDIEKRKILVRAVRSNPSYRKAILRLAQF